MLLRAVLATRTDFHRDADDTNAAHNLARNSPEEAIYNVYSYGEFVTDVTFDAATDTDYGDWEGTDSESEGEEGSEAESSGSG
jgi:hypothetical protein